MSLKNRHLWGAGAAVCAVCCAVPLMTPLGIGPAGTAATVATFAFAGLTFAVVVGLGTLAAMWTQGRRRHTGAVQTLPDQWTSNSPPAGPMVIGSTAPERTRSRCFALLIHPTVPGSGSVTRSRRVTI